MATYELPTEPTVDVVWVTDRETGAVTRCPVHVPADPSYSRLYQHGNEMLNWRGLLSRGKVSDHHPDLIEDAPLPWSYVDARFVDAHGRVVVDSAEVRDLIVRAVNAYGERLTAGEVPAPVEPASTGVLFGATLPLHADGNVIRDAQGDYVADVGGRLLVRHVAMAAEIVRRFNAGGAAHEVDTEWGVADRDSTLTDDEVRGVEAPWGLTVTDRDHGRVLVCRPVIRGPWTVDGGVR